MNPDDLRIGNWIIEDETIYTYGKNKIERPLSLSDFQIEDEYFSDHWDMIKPIALSEEWFMRFGLDHNGKLHSADSETKEKSIQDIGIRYVSYFFNDRLGKWMDCQTRITFDYVHEVQNHYKVMTKKELLIKTKE